MGNVSAGGVNEGEDDENEFFEVCILFQCKLFCLCKDVAAVSLTGIQDGPKKSNSYLQSLVIYLLKPVLTVILGYNCKLFHKAFACQGM